MKSNPAMNYTAFRGSFNEKAIKPFNVFDNIKVREYTVKALKKYNKDSISFDDLAKEIKGMLMNQEWTRCEYESIVWPKGMPDRQKKVDCCQFAEHNIRAITYHILTANGMNVHDFEPDPEPHYYALLINRDSRPEFMDIFSPESPLGSDLADLDISILQPDDWDKFFRRYNDRFHTTFIGANMFYPENDTVVTLQDQMKPNLGVLAGWVHVCKH